jgi:biotin-dependent carboxylase-like uncharacterized protein
MPDSFLVLDPGSYTTVQDDGRHGFQKLGVPVSGALDGFASRLANLLVKNPEDSAVLECTVAGPTLAVLRPADVAVAGAAMDIWLNNRRMSGWASFRVEPGDTLRLGQATSGCRAYLAVTGGIEVPMLMGSRSTTVSAGLGGLQGRPLRKGDILATGPAERLAKHPALPREWIPEYEPEIRLRAIPGPQDDFFDNGLETFFTGRFQVGSRADRMGYRLDGPQIARAPGMPESIISEPSQPGNIQVPADGQPIILLVEQTIGGYTKIASLVSADLWKVAQAVPGTAVSFQKVDLGEAHFLLRQRLAHLAAIRRFLQA